MVKFNPRLTLTSVRTTGPSLPAPHQPQKCRQQCRQQCVRLEGVCSNFKTVKSGVPQGSLLGPLLFNIFINDLNFCVPNVSLRLYADDTTAYLSDVSPTILEFSFNKDLQTLSSWFESNHLTVNSTKTQALSVGPCDYHYSLLYRHECFTGKYTTPGAHNHS